MAMDTLYTKPAVTRYQISLNEPDFNKCMCDGLSSVEKIIWPLEIFCSLPLSKQGWRFLEYLLRRHAIFSISEIYLT